MAILTRAEAESKDAAKARLLATIEELLGGPARCVECGHPLTNVRSIQLGLGPVCRARRFGGTR
jgi:hypothetical protein